MSAEHWKQMSNPLSEDAVFASGDALVVVDVFNDFDHEDGDRLLESFGERVGTMADVLREARRVKVPVLYVNDEHGRWQSDAPSLVREALAAKGGHLIEPLLPADGEAVILKQRYSAFDHTALDLLLEARRVERIVLLGAAVEGCVVQTAIDARELGLKVTIVSDACATTDRDLEQIALRYAARVGGVRVEQRLP
ncbi:MAG: isochorismatase family cysteine hydrolase [Gaiellaceae bacterium]